MKFAYHLFIETPYGPCPVGYITTWGIPVLYGKMWSILHLDFQFAVGSSDAPNIPVI